MIPEVHLREGNYTDVSLISGLIRESFHDVARRFELTVENCPKHPSNCTGEWIQNDSSRGVIYYILESNRVAVGCVALEKINSDLCYLERLGVLPEARGKGFGRALVDQVISQANLYGAKLISIGIIADDTKLKVWYQGIGFVEGETKEFEHLPFLVTFMTYEL